MNFRIYYTSDIHGHLFPTNYATGTKENKGLLACIAHYKKDGNTLVMDGGDTIQGSPYTMYISEKNNIPHPIATAFNFGGYDYVTLGNHDFNYGEAHLASFLHTLEATCLCGNAVDKSGQLPIQSYDIKTLENGLKIGVVGTVTDYVPKWEKAENIPNMVFLAPFEVAKENLGKIKDKVDVTICLYHGGFERNIDTGEKITDSTENIGYRICQELDFDLLLSAHQHRMIEGQMLHGTYIVQVASGAKHFLQIEGTVNKEGITFTSRFQDPANTISYVGFEKERAIEAEVNKWLDEPVGQLNKSLLPEDKITMAVQGSDIANFFNQVQLAISGADISCTSLANDIKGFTQHVTIRDVVSTYVYPNSLITIQLTGKILKEALERAASYVDIDEQGNFKVSDRFLIPKIEHYNYDFFAGVTYQVNVDKPVGERVSRIKVKDKFITDTDTFTLCMNSYRLTGAGGYHMYIGCPVVKEESLEISELIIRYLMKHEIVEVTNYPAPTFLTS